MTIKKKIEEATVSIIADKRETSSGKYRLYVRVSWQLQTKLFPINAAIPKKFWPHLYTSRVPEVKAVARKAVAELDRYSMMIRDLLSEGKMSMLQLVKKSHRKNRKIIYLDEIITMIYDEKISMDKINTANTYLYLLRILEACYNKKLHILDVNLYDFVERMRNLNNGETTIAIRLRTLKAVYNRLVKIGQMPSSSNPFNDYVIKKSGPSKRYLDGDTLDKIKRYSFSEEKLEGKRCVRLWLLSYYMQGINMTDLLRLRMKNYITSNNVIVYNRHKTGEKITVPVNDRILFLIRSLGNDSGQDDDYIINYLKSSYSEAETVRHVAYLVRQINKTMQKIFGAGISTYTARHTFATNMLRAGASTEIIQSCLGHTSVTTTQIYLSGFDNSQISKYTDQL